MPIREPSNDRILDVFIIILLGLVAAYIFLLIPPADAQTTFTDRLDGLTTSEAVKAPVRVGTTANITLSGTQTIDGVAVVANDRVLVKNQSTASQNGIYIASASTWHRAKDFDGARDAVKGTFVYITDGAQANTAWQVTTSNTFTIGTDNIAFQQTAIPTSFTTLTTSGNATIGGTLTITGAATMSNTANVVGDFSVNTNKFTVAASSGNTAVTGTLGVTSNLSINTNKFNVTAASGNTTIAGTVGVTGDVAVNTNMATISGSTGAMVLASSLTAASIIPTGSTLPVNGFYLPAANTLGFASNSTARGRITSGGDWIFGAATAVDVISSATSGLTYENSTGVVRSFKAAGGNMNVGHATSGGTFVNFYYTTNAIGSITATGTTATAYNTSSDRRRKKNITHLRDCVASVKRLLPRAFDWKADSSHDNGFIAQEVAKIPEFERVVNKLPDGYYGLDYARFTPYLVCAVQEQEAKIERLESLIDAHR